MSYVAFRPKYLFLQARHILRYRISSMSLLFLLAIQKLLYSLALAIFLTEFTALLVTFLFLISELNWCHYLIIDGITFFLTKDYPLTLLSKYHSDKRGYLLGLRLAFSFNLGQFILDFIRQRLMRFLCRKLILLQQFLTFGRILVTKGDERLHEHVKHISQTIQRSFLETGFSCRHLLANLFTYILGDCLRFLIYIRLTLIQSLITFLQFLGLIC